MRYWKWIDKDGKTTSVQSCSNDRHEPPDAVEIDEAEFLSYLDSLPKPVLRPVRDLTKELDNLIAKLKAAGLSV